MLKNAAIFAPNDTVASALTAYAEAEGFANYHVFADREDLLANVKQYSHVITAEDINEVADNTDHLTVQVIHLI